MVLSESTSRFSGSGEFYPNQNIIFFNPLTFLSLSAGLIENAPSGWSHDEPLTACIEKSRVLECEAAYYFPTNVDICENAYPAQESDGANSSVAEAGHLVIHVRSGDIFRSRIAYGTYGQVSTSRYFYHHSRIT